MLEKVFPVRINNRHSITKAFQITLYFLGLCCAHQTITMHSQVVLKSLYEQEALKQSKGNKQSLEKKHCLIISNESKKICKFEDILSLPQMITDKDIRSTVWNPEGNKLYISTVDENAGICIYDVHSNDNSIQFIKTKNCYHSPVFNAQSNTIAFSFGAKHICAVDINQKKETFLSYVRHIVPGFTFTTDGAGILFYSHGIKKPCLCLWKINDPKGDFQQFEIRSDMPFINSKEMINSIAFTSDKKTLAVSHNNQLGLCNIENLNDIKIFSSVHCPNTTRIIFRAGDKSLITCECKPRLFFDVFNIITVFNINESLQIIPQSTMRIEDVNTANLTLTYFETAQCSPDGNHIITSARTKDMTKSIIVLFNISDLNNISHQVLGEGKDISIAPSKDNSCTIAFINNDALVIWPLWTAKNNIANSQLDESRPAFDPENESGPANFDDLEESKA